MTMYGEKSGPHRKINMVCTLDVHGNTHCRGVRHKWMGRIVGGHDDARANRLLSEVILKDLFLDPVHNFATKETDHCQVHTCIH